MICDRRKVFTPGASSFVKSLKQIQILNFTEVLG